MNPIAILLGPLAGTECRRAIGRGWLILVRALAALAIGVVVVSVLWFWWFSQQTEPYYQPGFLLRGTTAILLGVGIVTALVMTPAVLAGSLAGEKTRGSLPLMLTTSVTSREIVLARAVAKLSQVGMILLAGLPAMVLLGTLSGFGPLVLLTYLALPAGVALGAAGLSAAASSLSGRGRDALWTVYLLLVLVLLSPLALPFLPAGTGLELLSPFGEAVLMPLIEADRVGPAWITIGLWSGVGVLGLAVAAWRLRPACLGALAARSRRDRGRRQLWVPPVGDRPMLWKELFIERPGSLGRLGRVLGVLVIVFLAGGSLILSGVIAWARWLRPDPEIETYAQTLLRWLYGGMAMTMIGFLIEGAVGLRAAVAIASERERNTWDGLLTSPLTGGEIVLGKLWGSLYAIRWLAAAALLSWTLCLALGVTSVREYVHHMALMLAVGAFLAAVGVRTSMATATATRAMSITMGGWLAAGGAVFLLSWILAIVTFLFWVFAWFMGTRLGLAGAAVRPWAPVRIEDVQAVLAVTSYVVLTSILASESRLRFDRIAGRMAGGGLEVAIDRMVHGRPMAPVKVSPREDGVADAPLSSNNGQEDPEVTMVRPPASSSATPS